MSSQIKVRGQPLGPNNYVIKNLQIDKVGVFSGACLVYYAVGTGSKKLDPQWLINPPDPGWGLPCVGAQATIGENGLVEINFNFEGFANQNNYGFAEREETIQFEMDASFADEPIETHPAFQWLKKMYGPWKKDSRSWPEYLTDAAGGTENAYTEGSDAENQKENPLFGVSSYLAVGAVFRKSYSSSKIPAGLFSRLGTIVQSPPGVGQFRIPAQGKRHNWLKMPPKVVRRGNCVQITEEWMMSGPKGWITPIYSAGQLG